MPRATLLGPAEIRDLADLLGIQPTKKLGQNFVHDANTVRRIVAASGVGAGMSVVEIGPGLGSLTLGLLEAGAEVVAVEIDKRLAEQLPKTVGLLQPTADLSVVVDASPEKQGKLLPGSRIPVAVLGATGAVGQSFIRLLADHPWFDVSELAASERSAGRPYAEATRWIGGSGVPEKLRDVEVLACDPGQVTAPIVFSALCACYLPAARASRVDPTTALRYE